MIESSCRPPVMTPVLRRLLCAALVVLVAGCGSGIPTGTVAGTVKLGDEPYDNVAVVFLSLETGNGGSANIQPGGAFRLDEPLAVGVYKVYLAPKAVEPGPTGEGAAGAEDPISTDDAVPEKYWNEASTDIEITVAEGDNNVTIPLEK